MRLASGSWSVAGIGVWLAPNELPVVSLRLRDGVATLTTGVNVSESLRDVQKSGPIFFRGSS